ncbi:MAG: hypothetical protein ACJAWV_000590 [Flammeovirgaceae bacterium]|jgi:hypothetical protein
MKKTLSICLLLFTFLQLKAQFTTENLKVETNRSTRFSDSKSDKLTYKNLRIYPIFAKQAFAESQKGVGNYMPLEKALKEKKILITEHLDTTHSSQIADTTLRQNRIRNGRNRDGSNSIQQRLTSNIGSSETVNTLYVENISEDTVFLMSGEVVKGGKQDRVIAQDMIIPPNSGKIDLSVFCVEKGRWTYKEDNGKFDGYFQMASMNVRGAIDKSKQQAKVWEEVSKVNEKNKVSTKTSAYTALTSSKEFKKTQEEYLSHFNPQLSGNHIIGMIAVTDDRVIGADIFASHRLFSKYSDKILQSYVTEAISNGKAIAISDKKVEKYVQNLLANEKNQEKYLDKDGNGKRFKHKGRTLHITSY